MFATFRVDDPLTHIGYMISEALKKAVKEDQGGHLFGAVRVAP